MSALLGSDSASPDETEAIAAALAASLRAGDVVLLEGELGAGKTCFVRGLARGLGADPRVVSSPTYTIAQEYAGAAVTLVHIDAYRLGDEDDLGALGIELAGTVAAIEWPARLAEPPPPGALRVTIDHTGESSRRLTFSGDPLWTTRLAAIRSNP